MTRENGAQWRLRACSCGVFGAMKKPAVFQAGWGGSGWAAGDERTSAGQGVRSGG